MNNQQRNALPQDHNIDPIPDSPSPEPNEVLRAPSPGTPRETPSPASTTPPPRMFESPEPESPPPHRSPTPPPQLVWNQLVNYYVTASDNFTIESERISYNHRLGASWDTVFDINSIRNDTSNVYPFKDILAIPEEYRSKFEKYILRQPVKKPPLFPVSAPQLEWDFITKIGLTILKVSEDETTWTLAQWDTNVLPTSIPSPSTQVRINRLKRKRHQLFRQFQLDDVFENEDILFEFMCNIIATVIIETRAVVWFFGSESTVSHIDSADISCNSAIRHQCICHLIGNYNEYTHHRTQIGESEGFGWAHREFVHSNAGASICTLCKFDKFVEGYTFKITEQHDDSLYNDCVCESLVHPPADII
jgi:hypothetical protein